MLDKKPNVIKYIDNQAQVYSAVKDILSYDFIGFDTETTGLYVLRGARIRLSQFALPNGTCYIFDCQRIDNRFHYDLFPSPALVIGQNLKFDIQFLNAQFGIKTYGSLFDTMLAGQVLGRGDIGSATKYSLLDLCKRYLNEVIIKDEQTSDWSRPELSKKQIDYAALDAHLCLRLYDVMLTKLKEEDQLRVAALEFEALPAVAEMELNGMELDKDKWLHQYKVAEQEIKKSQEHLWDYFDGYQVEGNKGTKGKGRRLTYQPTLFEGATVLPLTTVKLKEAFALKGVELPIDAQGKPTLRDFKVAGAIATMGYDRDDADALRAAVTYAQVKKQMTSYGPEWFEHINPHTRRIHQSYKQIGAETGRFSCYKPNLQQIPKGDGYRNCFIAGEGFVFVDADYSQAELRILAEYCRDKNFLKAFDSGLDLHKYTASLIYKTPFDDVTKKQRGIAKNMNFLIVYGGGAMKLAESTGMTFDEALVILKLYLTQTYPGMKQWLDNQAHKTVRTMVAETMTGRKREYFGDINDDIVSSKIERNGKNLPIQGTCVDITKRALKFVYDEFKDDPKVEMCHVIHDEIILRARPDVALDAEAKLKECMLRAEREYLWRVPSVVDTSITRLWAKEPNEAQLKEAQDYIKEWTI